MSRIGVKLQNALGIDECLALGRYAETRGLDSVWVSEYRARDAITSMALLAAATERVSIGSSIVPIYTRSPVVLGMSLAALCEIAPGRIVLGLGTSSDVVVSRWNGRARTRPLRAMRDWVRIVRQVASGATTDHDGELAASSGFSLELERLAAPAARIFVAALGEGMLRLSAEVADGVLLNHPVAGRVAAVRALVAAAAAEHGRAPAAVPIATDLRVGVGAGREAATMREAQRRQLASYGNVPSYNRLYETSGFASEAAALRDAWSRGDAEAAVAAVGDELLDAIVAVGGEDAVQQRIADLFDAGVDEIIVFPLWGETPQAEATRRIIDLAAEARPRDRHAPPTTTAGSLR